jgi:hypothetical protein
MSLAARLAAATPPADWPAALDWAECVRDVLNNIDVEARAIYPSQAGTYRLDRADLENPPAYILTIARQTIPQDYTDVGAFDPGEAIVTAAAGYIIANAPSYAGGAKFRVLPEWLSGLDVER